jgi:hypothetical protein
MTHDDAPKVIIGFALLLVLFCLGLTSAPHYVDFACYVHGVRTETQAGILRAKRLPGRPELWAIYVEDAGVGFYLQRPGETCGVETAP